MYELLKKQFDKLTDEEIVQKIGQLSHSDNILLERLLQEFKIARAAAAARNSLMEFIRLAWPVLEPGTPLRENWHIEVICAHLEAVTHGHIRRLLINIPPGHMKSLIVSVFWPAWIWLQEPTHRFLCASYSMNLSLVDNGRCKDLVESTWYQKMFRPTWKLRSDTKAKRFYKNSVHGSRRGISVLGETTGFRADTLIIDDPLNASDATSTLKLQRANHWFDKSASTRLADPAKGAIVIVMQRLHEDDVSGHVLKQIRNRFEHLCIPSYFEPERAFRTVLYSIPRYARFGTDPRTEPGELLFKSYFTREAVENLEESLGLAAFAGQHQQRPAPERGNLIKKEMLCQESAGRYTFWPYPTCRITEAYFGWDTALKDKSQNDLTAGCVSLSGEDGYIYLVPVELDRMEVPAVEKTIALHWARWSKRLGSTLRGTRIEEGAGTALIQYLRRLVIALREQTVAPPTWPQEDWQEAREVAPINVLPFRSTVGKVERLNRVLPYLNGRRVRLVDTHLSQAWLDNLTGFPLMRHDDAVDATVASLQVLLSITDKGEPMFHKELMKKMIAPSEEYFDDE